MTALDSPNDGERNAISISVPLAIITVFGGLYAAQGFTASLAQFVLPSVLREKGVPLAQIGMTYLLFSPLVLKPLWAPALDRWSAGQATRRLATIYASQVVLVLVFLGCAIAPISLHAGWLAATLFMIMFVVASQDISTDALAIESVPASRRGIAGSAQVAGVYIGYVLGSSAWLPFYVAFGWTAAMLALAVSLIVLTVVVKLAARGFVAAPRGSTRHPASVLVALRRPEFLIGIGFLILYQIGGRLAASLLGPFMIDAGMSLAIVSWVVGIGTIVAGICGAMFGPIFIRRLGISRFLCLFALLHAASIAGLLTVSVVQPPYATTATIGLVVIQSALFALAYVGLFVRMMEWCSTRQPGTDFSLLQSIDSGLAIAAGVGANLLAGAIGYSLVFTLSVLLLLAAGAAAFVVGRSKGVTSFNVS